MPLLLEESDLARLHHHQLLALTCVWGQQIRDREALWLVGICAARCLNLSAISIVGPSGVGKTQ